MDDNNLCEICDQLSVEKLVKLYVDSNASRTRPYYRLPDGAWLPHHSSYDNLIASAREGCVFCNEIWTACKLPRHHYRQGDGDKTRDYDSVEKVLEDLNYEGPINTELEICITASHFLSMHAKARMDMLIVRVGRYDLVVEFKLHSSRDQIIKCGDFIIGRYDISPDLGSNANFNVAMSWLSTCQDEHGEFCLPIQPTALPDRVLDVGSLDNPGGLRLIETHGAQGVYLTLSHSWGDAARVLQTTSKNLQKMLKGIEFSEMPKTFQDAIVITRRLGYQYIWIDSLCILQDSREDWETAAAKMGGIYMASALTIAAAFSKDSSGGLLNIYNEPPATVLRNALRITTSKDCYKPISISRKYKYEEKILDGVIESHLATRGWALQEQYLSERVLYYGERQIYWGCRGLRCAADGEEPDSYDESLFRRWNRTNEDGRNKPSAEMLATKHREMYATWYTILGQYSKRNLTIEGDKFPALSGLAAQFAQLTGDKYIAGIWERDLKIGLLWHCEDPQKTRRPREFRAPSWSWASLDASIKHEATQDSANASHDIEVLSWDVQFSGKDHFGSVQAARITLSGYTWPLVKIDGDISKVEIQRDQYFGQPVFDVASDGNGGGRSDMYFDNANQTFVCGWKQPTDGERGHIVGESLTLLLVHMIRDLGFPYTNTGHEGTNNLSFYKLSQYGALILRSVSEEEALYERVGYLSMYCTLSLYENAWSKSVVNII